MTLPDQLVRTDADRQRLRAIILSWVGTPFHPHAGIKGVGVDCVHLGAEIFREAGHVDGYAFPTYSLGAGHHRDASQLTDWLDACPRFQRVPRESPLEVADVLCFRIGRCAHHLGVSVGGTRFVHALQRRKVLVSQLDDPTYGRRLVAVYRPVLG